MTLEAPGVLVGTPRVEHVTDALGIGESHPRLSFIVEAAPNGWRQVAHEIEVSGSGRGGQTFTSGRIDSEDDVLVPWPTSGLSSRERRQVRVRVWGRGEPGPSAWSPPVVLEAGLLKASDWSAAFVTPEWDIDPAIEQTPPLVRGAFEVDGVVERARAYVTALGLYELEINGAAVGDLALTPGWTSYHHRLRYQTYDVTTHIRQGPNAIGAWLGEGWYAGRLAWRGGVRGVYGQRIALCAQLEITFSDGRRQVVVTDESWQASNGPILQSGIYDGETYDARREQPGWSTGGYETAHWEGVGIVDPGEAAMVAPIGPPVRCTQELPVAEVVDSNAERIIVDFGQNLVGRCRITVEGSASDQVQLRHAEVLQDGEIYVRPLREAKATDTYTLRGGGPEEWEPRFTFHGFRFVEIRGWPGRFDPAAIRARVIHTDMERTGDFECSDPLVNRLHDNVVWSMRGNFLDVPTDCPQRDERMGWTGDIQVFAPTASFLFDCAGMLDSWLRDLAAEQLPDGTVPWFIPTVPTTQWTPSPAAVWGDAAVLTPWTLYERFGDVEILRRQYHSAKSFVDLVAERAGPSRLWDEGWQLGDWLDPTAPADDPADAKADRYLVATAYFAHSTATLGAMAATLGFESDAAHYEAEADAIADAFRARFMEPSGALTNEAQTSYALALRFGLIPEGPQRDAAVGRLVALVEEAGFRVATGFAGTPVICDALTENGAVDTAYQLLLSRECPSWLYPVAHGATTIWERWDALLADGSVNPGQMTSFNHYAFGAVADWLQRSVAGLAPITPGYRRLLVKPRPGGGLSYARAALRTPYGRAAIHWQLIGERLEVDVEIPIGVLASIELPGQAAREAGSGRHHFTVDHAAM